jgi:predicted Zn-dependent protease
MALLTADEAQALLKKVLSFSKADECEVTLTGGEGGNLRYARNSVSTSGASRSMDLIVSSVFGRKMGTTTINEYDDASLQKVVQRAETLAHLAPDNPEYMPLLSPQTYGPAAPTFIPATAGITSAQRTDLAGQSLQIAKEAGLTAAGYIQNGASFTARMNSHGLWTWHTETGVNFSVTLRTNDGAGSGYSSRGYMSARPRRRRHGKPRTPAAPAPSNRGNIP